MIITEANFNCLSYNVKGETAHPQNNRKWETDF